MTALRHTPSKLHRVCSTVAANVFFRKIKEQSKRSSLCNHYKISQFKLGGMVAEYVIPAYPSMFCDFWNYNWLPRRNRRRAERPLWKSFKKIKMKAGHRLLYLSKAESSLCLQSNSYFSWEWLQSANLPFSLLSSSFCSAGTRLPESSPTTTTRSSAIGTSAIRIRNLYSHRLEDVAVASGHLVTRSGFS